jgi:hypothetical protein
VFDPAYKIVAMMWAKDLAESLLFLGILAPVLRRIVKKYLGGLQCPHCGRHFTEEKTAANPPA